MGSEGKRAVWIERKRSSTGREVLIWSKGPDEEGSTDATTANPDTLAVEMPKKAVFSIRSHDLRGS